MGSKNSNKKNKLNKDSSEPEPSLPVQDSNKHGKRKDGGDENIITDSRFSSVHWDPRFQNVPKHKAKVAIDSRFDRMFSDKRFGSSSVQLDKRGKPKKLEQGNSLRHYYRIDEDQGKANSKDEEEEEEESESDELEELGEEESEDDVASGDSETATDTDTDDEFEDEEVVYEDGVPEIQEEDIPEIEKETHRLAIVNLDWRHVKAVDLYTVLRSFLPKGGEMKSVAVYPSDFGLQRMKEEELHGPVGLFDDENEKSDEDEDDDDDDELDAQKLRAYEKSRLRYYYAVVECDSIATADYLYKNCDGVEFERSSNKLDLRFIPDSMEFKHPPRDIATEVPASYVGLNFQTQALQQSKIDISWDEDDPARKTLKRKFTEDQLSELELKEFLASDESESDETENDDPAEDKSDRKSKKRDMYRALLQSGDGEGDGDGDGDASDRDGEDNDQDMEITFNTGLEDLSKKILEKRDKESETVWEAYLRKRREKKKDRKNRSKDSSEDESSDADEDGVEEPDDFFIEEPSVKRSKKGSKGKSKKEEKQQDRDTEGEASRNELELLLADEKGADSGLKGYNLKRKKTKGKKGKDVQQEDKLPTVDYEDPRFSALFTSSRFALDPTDPQFKRSAAYARQVTQRQQKGDQEEVPEREVKSHVSSSKIEKSSLIKSIKMKAQPFDGKMQKQEENLQSKGKKEKKNKQEAPTSVEPVKKRKKNKA